MHEWLLNVHSEISSLDDSQILDCEYQASKHNSYSSTSNSRITYLYMKIAEFRELSSVAEFLSVLKTFTLYNEIYAFPTECQVV